ncbi:unnamed protein product [Amoebophrya sp. A120]|nr:unnamed protein product [Amoebophrya sp. A120]|eukprot:GSA120T00019906001.1
MRRFFSTGGGSSSSAAHAQQTLDPYKLLGLQRTASAAEVKARYRELAKQNHPDLNKNDPNSAARMAKITDAYSVLTDPRKRRQLDAAMGSTSSSSFASGSSGGTSSASSSSAQHHHADPDSDWQDPSQMYSEFSNIFGKMASRMHRGNSASRTSGPMQSRGDDASIELSIPFVEAMKGSRRTTTIKLQLPCNDCGASGAAEGAGWVKCNLCNGTGVRRVERGIMSMGLPCAKCGGVGEILEKACRTCFGEGVQSRKTSVEIDIPPGIKPGMELRLCGQGHAGKRGGPRGHLFVVVNVEKHNIFRHVDDDVHADVGISLKQMLLGGVTKIPTLDEGEVNLTLPALQDPNSTRILRGKGPTRLSGMMNSGGMSNSNADSRGNLVLHFHLQLPENLTEDQKDLISAFDQIEAKKKTSNGSDAKSGGGK